MDVRGMEVRWRVCRAACGPVGGFCVCCCCPLCVRRLVLVLFHATAVLIYTFSLWVRECLSVAVPVLTVMSVPVSRIGLTL